MLCQIGFQSLGQLTPSQHDTSPAALAFEPDVRAQACDNPFIGATGVLFPEAEMIVQAKVG
jgi:hypothetical protein